MDHVILYQVVCWMNERKRLTELIHQTDGDNQFLLNKRKKLDETMALMLNQWTQPPKVISIDLKTVELPPVPVHKAMTLT